MGAAQHYTLSSGTGHEEFLAEVRGMQRRNLAVELLQKLLAGELATRRRKNVVQGNGAAQHYTLSSGTGH